MRQLRIGPWGATFRAVVTRELLPPCRYIWKNEGDTAILFDPNDEEVSRLDATAHTVALGSPPGGLDFSDGDQGKGFCAVM